MNFNYLKNPRVDDLKVKLRFMCRRVSLNFRPSAGLLKLLLQRLFLLTVNLNFK